MKKSIIVVMLIVILLMCCACGNANKNDAVWPTTKTVEIYTPLAAGGGTDLYARLLTERLGEITGANFVVINQTEGGGAIAYNEVKNAPADGSKLLVCTPSLYTSYLNGLHDVHPLDDYTTVSIVEFTTPHYIVVPKNSPINTLEDFVAYATENPGEMTFGMQIGSISHYIAQSAVDAMGVSVRFVEAGSDGNRITAVLGENVQASMVNGATVAQYAESGDVKVLCGVYKQNGGDQIPEALKEVPSLSDCGYKDSEIVVNVIFMAPKGISEEMANEMCRLFYEAETTEAVVAKAEEMNMYNIYREGMEATTKWSEESFNSVCEAHENMDLG